MRRAPEREPPDPEEGHPRELPDPEARRQRARQHAWRALNRRDRTVAELRGLLDERGVEAVDVEAVLAELMEGGYLDDARFAERFAEDRRRLDGWGAERIARRLRELGVAGEHVEAALGARDADREEEAALALLRRRFPVAPAERRERDRALAVLLRKGYAPEVAIAALREHAAAPRDDHAAFTNARSFAPHSGRY